MASKWVISPTYKWDILGLQPIHKAFTNFLRHPSDVFMKSEIFGKLAN